MNLRFLAAAILLAIIAMAGIHLPAPFFVLIALVCGGLIMHIHARAEFGAANGFEFNSAAGHYVTVGALLTLLDDLNDDMPVYLANPDLKLSKGVIVAKLNGRRVVILESQ